MPKLTSILIIHKILVVSFVIKKSGGDVSDGPIMLSKQTLTLISTGFMDQKKQIKTQQVINHTAYFIQTKLYESYIW